MTPELARAIQLELEGNHIALDEQALSLLAVFHTETFASVTTEQHPRIARVAG
ncbi:hypothetical protein [Agreia bicolorata]|uniref:hypothetical protein n=1 Tax=Agreia bicolorata TaxID=110935 RepID=UPI000A4AFF87|nr:hypothetical protein [Agreia bicolorata]